MKHYTAKKQTVIQANNLIGQEIYDTRFDQYYTVASREKFFFTLAYEMGCKKEAVSFVVYCIKNGSHLIKK